MVLWAVGAVINVLGSILINLGTNIIKLGHTRTAALAEGPHPKLLRQPRRWWRTPGNKLWLSGMAAFSVGNLLNFASFAFAAQSLLSALGVVQFISNIVFGRFVNKEKVTKRVLFATAVVCAGCVLLVLFGNHESPTLSTHDMLELYSNPAYIVYLCFIFTCAPIMYGVYRHGKRAVLADHTGAAAKKWARWLPISYALFAGVLGTQSVLYGKTMSMLLRTTFSGDSQFDHWYTWISILLFLLFAGFWMSRYSKAMKLFPVLIIMPIIQIVWVLFSMISGSLYYQEYKTLDALSGSMFAVGVVVLLAGVYLLTGGQAGTVQQPVQHPELKVGLEELGEEERERVGELDQAALRSKAPLSDNLGMVVELSTAAAVLEPEDALVARKLSTVYERKSTQSLHSLGAGLGGGSPPMQRLGARPASAPVRGEGGGAAANATMLRGARGWPAGGDEEEGGGNASEESQAQLMAAGARDSATPDVSPFWAAANGASSEASSRPAGKPLSEVIASRVSEEEGGEGEGERPHGATSAASGGEAIGGGAAGARAAVGGLPPPPASLMHDIRSDWGVGMRDLNAVMRASVGLPQDDEEGTAFSIWSMPMCCSASFTASRARSMDLPTNRATFRLRSAFEQQFSQSSGTRSGGPAATTDDLYTPGTGRGNGGGSGTPGSRLQRPGHRRINRSRSANELDDMLRAAALGEDVDLTGPPGTGGPSGFAAAAATEMDGDSLGSAWQATSSAATRATGAAAAADGSGEYTSRSSLPAAAPVHHRHRPHLSSGSAPVLSTMLDGGESSSLTPPRQALAAPAAGVNPQLAVGLSPALSHSSRVDESEGPAGSSPPLREGGISVSDFLSSMSLSPPASQGNIETLGSAVRVRQQAGKKGDKAS